MCRAAGRVNQMQMFFLYEVLTFIGDSAQGGVDTETALNKDSC